MSIDDVSPRGGRRPFLAEEVIQSSAMDCGPAVLKCLLSGYGLRLDYDRLREACATGVDGTSIDALQDVLIQLGVPASQHVVPVDAFGAFLATGRPFIAVVRTPYGGMHFEVVWSRVGPWLQIMDPNVGRKWIRQDEYERTLVVLEHQLPADIWSALAQEAPLGPWLELRLDRVGVREPRATIDRAIQAHGWRGYAAVDAAARMVDRLAGSGSAPSAFDAAMELSLADLSGSTPEHERLPRALFSAMPAGGLGEDELVVGRGAVLLAIADDAASAEVARATGGASARLVETQSRAPARDFWHLVGDGVAPTAVLVATATVFAVVGALVEAVTFRASFTLISQLRVPLQGATFIAMIVAFMVALLFVESSVVAATLWAGRYGEARLRIATLEKLPRLADVFFRSRSLSDLAQRAQNVSVVGGLANAALQFVRAAADLALTAVAIALLDPALSLYSVGALAAAVLVPLAAQRLMFERELKLTAHSAALSTATLDALRGAVPTRMHGAERAMRTEYANRLAAWLQAARDQQRLSIWVTSAQLTASVFVLLAMVFAHASHVSDGQRLLLLFFWAQRIPLAGDELVAAMRIFSDSRAQLLRIQEPLRATERALPPLPANAPVVAPRNTDGAKIEITGVRVMAGGFEVLRELDLTVEPGEKIAIVGRSGAGKTSLIGLLLGWHEPAEGRVLVDGEPLSETSLERLRGELVWVDPSVHLWSTSLVENVTYGSNGRARRPMSAVLEHSDLVDVLERLPGGLQTELGEAGGLVSGGEGQRVRFARAVCRRDARLVLLDEPFRGLDRERRRTLLARVPQLWPDATTLFVTHDVAETVDFARVILIEDGRIVEDGTPADLLAQPTRYRTMVEVDRAARETTWHRAGWRSLRVENGRLIEPTESAS